MCSPEIAGIAFLHKMRYKTMLEKENARRGLKNARV
jgi:hypothetical protein